MICGDPIEIRFHMPRLDYGDVLYLLKVADHARPKAPTFWDWMTGILQQEQLRVYSQFGSNPLESQFPYLIYEEWSPAAISEAFTTANALTYMAWPVPVARFLDEVAHAFNQLAAEKLLESAESKPTI